MMLRSFRWGLALATLPICILLASTVPAQDAPPDDSNRIDAQALIDAGRFEEAIVALRPLLGQEPVDTSVLFLYGVASLEAAQRSGRAPDDRAILLNEATAAFRLILVNRPDLVRVRLELARAFFLRGQDGLARRHFEAVLAGGVPQPVAAKIYGFLAIMQARKRWTGYFGAAIAPDSNLNAASESEIIYIDTAFGRLPFTRQGDFGAESGFGLSVWGGGEYRQRQPGNGRLKLRLGGDTALREYPGGDFDQFFLASHVGPLWQLGPRTELSLLATAQRQWLGSQPYADEFGGRLELDRQLTSGIWARGTAAYRQRDHLSRDFLDGPVVDFTAAFAWTPAPVLRVHMTVGYTRDHAALEHWRSLSRWVRMGTSLALPLGFTLGTSIQVQRVYYDGAGQPHLTLDRKGRRDRIRSFTLSVLNRAFTLYGFSPQLALIHEVRMTNAQAQEYERNRAELRFVRQF